MTIFDNVFPLGFGTNRLPIKSASDEEGIEKSANLIADAIRAGVEFIDVTNTYSRGKAMDAVKRAFEIYKPIDGVTVKMRLSADKTAADAYNTAESILKQLGISHAKYFYFWSVFTYEEYLQTLKPGGVFEGALRLKKEGIIDNICFSTHAIPNDIVKMLESRNFDAVTISMNLLNSFSFNDVLRTADDLDIGVAVMNPLGGGIIPKNPEYFSFAKGSDDRDVPEAALRYVLAHKPIQIALSGISSHEELQRNLEAVSMEVEEKDEERLNRVNVSISGLENFCVGCNYCSGCLVDIPVMAIMRCRNNLQFKPADQNYAFLPEYVQQNIYVCGKIEQDFSVLFEDTVNPCIKCGKCEHNCTQHLNIIDAVADTYKRAEYSNWSRQDRINKLKEIIDNTPDNTIGIYPSGITSSTIRRFYEDNIEQFKCKIVSFDSNPSVWGSDDNGIMVYSPDDILDVHPDVIIITSYKFKNEIYENIKKYESYGIKIVKLSDDNELPWLL